MARVERVLVEAVSTEPDSEWIVRDDWVQVVTPSSRWPNHNMILKARLEASRARHVADEVAAEHAARGARYRWVIGPSSAPADLAKVVAASGLSRMGGSRGMAMAVPSEDPPLGVEGLTVKQVGRDDVGHYAELTARAWEKGEAFREALEHIIGASVAGQPVGKGITMSWIASVHGEPVATSHLRVLSDLGYFQGAAVLPTWRGRGVYRALLRHRLAVLRAHGIGLAVVWADAEGSAKICDGLGFETICTAEFFEST